MAGFGELKANFSCGFHIYTGPPFIVQAISGLEGKMKHGWIFVGFAMERIGCLAMPTVLAKM
jgi:hypothetical protein